MGLLQIRLLIKAIGKQLVCVHVNHGLLRKGEPEQVIEVFRNRMDAELVYVDAVDRFLDKFAGVDDSERKRKIISNEFTNIIVHSSTKYIDGHATSIGGIIVDGGNFNWDNGKYPELTKPDVNYHGIKYIEDRKSVV